MRLSTALRAIQGVLVSRISTDHRGTADGEPLRVFFSEVSVKLVGSDTWVHAQ